MALTTRSVLKDNTAIVLWVLWVNELLSGTPAGWMFSSKAKPSDGRKIQGTQIKVEPRLLLGDSKGAVWQISRRGRSNHLDRRFIFNYVDRRQDLLVLSAFCDSWLHIWGFGRWNTSLWMLSWAFFAIWWPSCELWSHWLVGLTDFYREKVNFSFLNWNICSFPSWSVTVNWISLCCWWKKPFKDVILGFGNGFRHFIDSTMNRLIQKIINILIDNGSKSCGGHLSLWMHHFGVVMGIFCNLMTEL